MGEQLHLTNENLPDAVRRLKLAGPDETIEVEAAGDGNINWVRRVRLSGGKSLIFKQARPALEKFPEYEVSTERLVFEARYLERAGAFDRDQVLPKVHGFDPEQRILVLEDLGTAQRLDEALAQGRDVSEPMAQVARFLARVHRGTRGAAEELAGAFQNEAMRRLHGDHIFLLPYREEFPAPPQTAARAEQIRADGELAGIAERAYQSYLRPTGPLVHADVQPTNLLLASEGPKLLDAEIAHAGDPAFDIATLIAHLVLPPAARGTPAAVQPLARQIWRAYADEHGAAGCAARVDVVRYAGLELVRRTIGAARVRFVESDAAGLAVLALGLSWIRTPELADPW